MEIVEWHEARKRVGGDVEIYLKFLVWHVGELYVGKWRDRQQPPTAFDQLEDVKLIPTKDRGPILRSDWKVASPHSVGWVKEPNWEAYLSPELEAQMEHEIKMCEMVRQYPHVNLATYRGCLLGNGQVKGLLFTKYDQSLLERVNPQRLSKMHFVQGDRSLVDKTMRGWLPQLRLAVSHLHKLGYVHNDITPANVMLDRNERPVLIDFEGLRRVGESLQKVKRTIGWHDDAVMLAQESNDWDALDEIEAWLFGKAGDLQFIG